MKTFLADIQNEPAPIPLDINRVGIKQLKLPLQVLQKDGGLQHTIADVDLSVDLPKEVKGTHMSRLLESLLEKTLLLSLQKVKELLFTLRSKLKAQVARASFNFPFFLDRQAPWSEQSFLMDFTVQITGILEKNDLCFVLEVRVPVMTVCPCSLAISEQGAHSQRAIIKLTAKIQKMVWIEDLINIGLQAGSVPVYPLLKRGDEKKVVESAFANPMFVEDVVRKAAFLLDKVENILGYRVEVESFESIHNHSAYAIISKPIKEQI